MTIATVFFLAIAAQAVSPPTACAAKDATCNENEARRVFREWQTKDAEAAKKSELGAGPHILVISDGKAMTRIDYKSGALCKRARDEVRRQVYEAGMRPGAVFYNPSMTAVCIPR